MTRAIDDGASTPEELDDTIEACDVDPGRDLKETLDALASIPVYKSGQRSI